MATLKNHSGFWLRDDAAAAFDRAEVDHGIFGVNSAGRTVAYQQNLINRWNTGGAKNRPPYLYKPAMPATASNHVKNGGTAIDTSDWRRFAVVCEKYGFRHSYPNSDPVHFDFIGGGSAPAAPAFNQVTLDLQNFLNEFRGEDLVPDGRAGTRTKDAYKRYQTYLKSRGWYSGSIDGVWGKGTQAGHDLYWAETHPPKPTPVPPPVVVPEPDPVPEPEPTPLPLPDPDPDPVPPVEEQPAVPPASPSKAPGWVMVLLGAVTGLIVLIASFFN